MKATLCNIAVNIIKILQLSVQFDPVGLLMERHHLNAAQARQQRKKVLVVAQELLAGEK